MEERFVLDNNNNIIDFEDETDKYCLSQDDVCNLLNKQHQRIAELEQELAELKEKAVVPRFEYGDKVYYIKYFVGKWQVFNQEYVGENISNIIVRTMNYYSELPKDSVFATEQEAQDKLKEIQGNE